MYNLQVSENKIKKQNSEKYVVYLFYFETADLQLETWHASS